MFLNSLAKTPLLHISHDAEKEKYCDINQSRLNKKNIKVVDSNLNYQNIILNAVTIKPSDFSDSFLEIELHGIVCF